MQDCWIGMAPTAPPLTMPVRLASWDQRFGIHPIFEMNLPEGYLREKLRLAFAKATGTFDSLDLLAIVGRSQIGRLRYTAPDEALDSQVPFQSVDEVLKRRRDGELFDYMMDRFAAYSGIAGVQPKVMIRDEKAAAVLDGYRSQSVQGATHIVKFWDPNEYPHLAANEYFCLLAAEKAGLTVPRRRLSEDASALVVDRFDLRTDGTYMGIEDFCVLNGKGTEKKYEGGYETAIFKRIKEFIPAEAQRAELEKLFILFVLNAVVRNGDAHLKNFALIYDEVDGKARLADVYDIVTTTVYMPKDVMALTLDGTPKWPDLKQLTKLGTLRCGLSPKEVMMIMGRVGTAVSEARIELQAYAKYDPSFKDVASAMAAQWEIGMRHSLEADAR
ncbi:type II toxin-antitoxin system HipA family toxin [Asticcacaulis benevestitus]|nr:type II toxin-antitoxin system HipA family toxin [Asticcacaulis benevestitus]